MCNRLASASYQLPSRLSEVQASWLEVRVAVRLAWLLRGIGSARAIAVCGEPTAHASQCSPLLRRRLLPLLEIPRGCLSKSFWPKHF